MEKLVTTRMTDEQLNALADDLIISALTHSEVSVAEADVPEGLTDLLENDSYHRERDGNELRFAFAKADVRGETWYGIVTIVEAAK